MKPVGPALDLFCCCSAVCGTTLVKDSITSKSSNTHVFPIEKVPLAFSLALCIRTRPDLRTATMITRAFLLSGGDSRGGGLDGYAASSTIRMCVIYDSEARDLSVQGIFHQHIERLTRSICLFLIEAALDNPFLLILEYLCPTHL